jgi:hypothetical protein
MLNLAQEGPTSCFATLMRLFYGSPRFLLYGQGAVTGRLNC